jgi:hypothetical protein
MEIDLRTCHTFVINLRKDVTRRESSISLCDRLGLTYRFIDGVACSPGLIGCGLSHIKALALATPGRPVLILEDDVAASDPFTSVVDVPDDADALYLGTSSYGAIDAEGRSLGCEGAIAGQVVSDRLFRSHNMLSTHAILYISDRYRRAASNALINALTVDGIAPDSGIARIHSQYQVYGLREPAFYQAADHQSGDYATKQERTTKPPVQIHPIGTVLILYLAEGARRTILVEDDARLYWRMIDAMPSTP